MRRDICGKKKKSANVFTQYKKFTDASNLLIIASGRFAPPASCSTWYGGVYMAAAKAQ